MFDYTLEEVLDLLKNIAESQIKESKHFKESNIGRFRVVGLIYELLLNQKPVQIGKTNIGTYSCF